MSEKSTAVEVLCPKCRFTKIIFFPKEDLPKCPQCKTQMMIKEILSEGKAY